MARTPKMARVARRTGMLMALQWRSRRRTEGSDALPDQLVDIALAQPDLRVVLAAEVDLGEHVLVPQHRAVRIDVDHRAVHLKQRDHLRHVCLDDKGVRLAGSLVD